MEIEFYTLSNDTDRRAAISFGGNVKYSKSVTEWEKIANLILFEIRRERAQNPPNNRVGVDGTSPQPAQGSLFNQSQ